MGARKWTWHKAFISFRQIRAGLFFQCGLASQQIQLRASLSTRHSVIDHDESNLILRLKETRHCAAVRTLGFKSVMRPFSVRPRFRYEWNQNLQPHVLTSTSCDGRHKQEQDILVVVVVRSHYGNSGDLGLAMGWYESSLPGQPLQP